MKRLSFALTLVCLVITPAAACSPPLVHAWFAVQIEADTSHVRSPNIEISIQKADLATDELVIKTHQTTQPLTVTLPNQQILIRQDFQWYENHVSQANRILEYSANATISQSIGAYAEDQRWEIERPTNVTIPDPRTSTINLAFQDQTFTVPVTVSYALNPLYDPKELQAYKNVSCFGLGQAIGVIIFYVVACLSIVAVALFIIVPIVQYRMKL